MQANLSDVVEIGDLGSQVKNRLDRALREISCGKCFHPRFHDAVTVGGVRERADLEADSRAIEEAGLAFEYFLRSRHALGGQHGAKNGVPRGVGQRRIPSNGKSALF